MNGNEPLEYEIRFNHLVNDIIRMIMAGKSADAIYDVIMHRVIRDMRFSSTYLWDIYPAGPSIKNRVSREVMDRYAAAPTILFQMTCRHLLTDDREAKAIQRSVFHHLDHRRPILWLFRRIAYLYLLISRRIQLYQRYEGVQAISAQQAKELLGHPEIVFQLMMRKRLKSSDVDGIRLSELMTLWRSRLAEQGEEPSSEERVMLDHFGMDTHPLYSSSKTINASRDADLESRCVPSLMKLRHIRLKDRDVALFRSCQAPSIVMRRIAEAGFPAKLREIDGNSVLGRVCLLGKAIKVPDVDHTAYPQDQLLVSVGKLAGITRYMIVPLIPALGRERILGEEDVSEVNRERARLLKHPDGVRARRGMKRCIHFVSRDRIPENTDIRFTYAHRVCLLLCDLLETRPGEAPPDPRTMLHLSRFARVQSSQTASTIIIARNLAHNIGSHVLSYWTHRLRRQASVEEGSNEEPDWAAEQLELQNDSINLVSYLKGRMDFITEIMTSAPFWEQPLLLDRDILRPFRENFPILDNIARSEGFCAALRGCLKTTRNPLARRDNCRGCPRLPPSMGDDPAKAIEPEPLEIRYMATIDLRVSIPYGPVGAHAVYSILENFIRNSAKYGGAAIRDAIKNPANDERSLTISISAQPDEDYPGYIRIRLQDNVGNAQDCHPETGESVVARLNRILGRDAYVDEQGNVRKGGWGIKEMSLAANFLRNRPVTRLFDDEDRLNVDKPPIIHWEAVPRSDSPETTDLAVIFYLRGPKEVLIVTGNSEVRNLPANGIDVIAPENFLEILRRGKTVPHRFLLILDGLSRDWPLRAYRDRLPMRILWADSDSHAMEDGFQYWRIVVPYSSFSSQGLSEAPFGFVEDLYRSFLKEQGVVGRIRFRRPDIQNRWMAPAGAADLPEIIYDNHFDMLRSNPARVDRALYYQGVSGSTPFGRFLAGGPTAPRDRGRILRELLESAGAQILIMDERIWNNNQDYVSSAGKTQRFLLKRMGIHLFPVHGHPPESALDGDRYPNIHFFVVHRGIVEKMAPSVGEMFIRKAVSRFPFVVLTSGAGGAGELPRGTRFVPIGILDAAIQERDKYALVQHLFATRRSADHENTKIDY